MIIDGYELSLDFANVSGWRSSGDDSERLKSYESVLRWALDEAILDEAEAGGLLARAHEEPQKVQEALTRIVGLRQAVYRIFVSAAHGRVPEPIDLELLNAELTEAMHHLRLSPQSADEERGSAFAWVWTDVEQHLTSILWPVSRSAAGLLTSPQLSRLRDCANETCGWLFIDHSKNASRRWCDMGECGNRAKARRFRERKRSEPVHES
jgi:predicted RNA-binding Zn ribbon-like protein